MSTITQSLTIVLPKELAIRVRSNAYIEKINSTNRFLRHLLQLGSVAIIQTEHGMLDENRFWKFEPNEDAQYHRINIREPLVSHLQFIHECNSSISSQILYPYIADRGLQKLMAKREENKDPEKISLYDLQAPWYLDIIDDRISVVQPHRPSNDGSNHLRQKLCDEQNRIARWFVDNWMTFNASQDALPFILNYERATKGDASSINIFSLDNDFEVFERFVERDIDALSGAALEQWKLFHKKHFVFKAIYPEMVRYEEELAKIKYTAPTKYDEFKTAIEKMRLHDDIIDASVPDEIQRTIADERLNAKKKNHNLNTMLASFTKSLGQLYNKIKQKGKNLQDEYMFLQRLSQMVDDIQNVIGSVF